MFSEIGSSHSRDPWLTSNRHQQDRNVLNSYLPSVMQKRESGTKITLDSVSSSDHIRRSGSSGQEGEIKSIDEPHHPEQRDTRPSIPDSSSSPPESQVLQVKLIEPPSERGLFFNKPVVSYPSVLNRNGSARIARNVAGMEEEGEPHFGLSAERSHSTGHDPNPGGGGGQRDLEPNATANNIQKPPTTKTGNTTVGPESAPYKLRWQTRKSDLDLAAYDDEGVSPDTAAQPPATAPPELASSVSKGMVTGDGIDGDDDQSSVKEIEASPWRPAASHRRMRSMSEDKRSLDEQPQQQQGGSGGGGSVAGGGAVLLRSPSDDSDRTSDMYDNPVSVGEYEPSETSSWTTADDVESNEGPGIPGRASSSGRYSPPPPSDHQGLVPGQGGGAGGGGGGAAGRSVVAARPNNIPRGSFSGRNTLSDDNSYSVVSFNPQLETEIPTMVSTDGSALLPPAVRGSSWDERMSRMGTGPAAGGGGNGSNSGSGTPQGPVSVRQKSSSQDYETGGGPVAPLYRVASDPLATLRGEHHHHVQASSSSSRYDSSSTSLPRQTFASGLPPVHQQQQQPWSSRYGPPTPHSSSVRSPALHQWPSNSSSSRPSYPYGAGEPPPMQPLHNPRSLHGSASSSSRQAGQEGLPSRPPGHYPRLPPPGALQHIECQCCGIRLLVPDKLPPPKNGMQKIRCGACRKVSIFSVSQDVDFNAAAVSRADSQHSLLASSPDSQPQFNSEVAGRGAGGSARIGESRRSGRSLSASDIGDEGIQVPIDRNFSIGSEDSSVAAEQEMAGETALSRKAELLKIDSSSTLGSSARSLTSPPSESLPPSNFSDMPTSSRLGGEGGHDSRISRAGPGSGEALLTSSDSESDIAQRLQVLPSNSRSRYSTSPPRQDHHPPRQHPQARIPRRGSDHGAAASSEGDARSLRGSLRGIFGVRKNRLGSAQFRRKVIVNGVPIADHLVSKAEEQAGPIHPGNYWYDSQAGFWGVLGGHCLGIIPPFIDEINYPMAQDCSGGRSRILVNGRELHHLDREKLSSRGLPNREGASYRIEIDGRVVDDNTGLELRGLGRLAPTLERNGRGSGLYTPSNIASGTRS